MKCVYTFVFFILMNIALFAQQNNKKLEDIKKYNNFTIDLDTSNCNLSINKTEIINKEFSNTKFTLDLENNILILSELLKEDSKVIEFTLNNSKIIFKDKEEYGNVEAYLIFKNKLPVIKFKDHFDDCFFYIILFDK